MRKALTLGPDNIGYMSEENIYDQCQEELKIKSLTPKANILRETLLSFIPAEILDTLTAESFSLLLSGVKKVDINMLKKDVSFKTPRNDEIKPSEKPIIGWFWDILENELTEHYGTIQA